MWYFQNTVAVQHICYLKLILAFAGYLSMETIHQRDGKEGFLAFLSHRRTGWHQKAASPNRCKLQCHRILSCRLAHGHLEVYQQANQKTEHREMYSQGRI